MASSSSSSFLLSAANVSWGTRECYTIKVNDAAADLGGEYFLIDALSSNFGTNVEYYAWFSDGVAADPAPAGKTAIVIDISGDTTAAEVATSLSAAFEAHSDFRGSLDSADTAIIEGEFKGAVTNAAADVDSLVTITKQRNGNGGDLGKTSGGVEVSMEAQSVQINSDQTGALVLDEVFTGSSVEATMSFLEMTPERWALLVGSVTGDTYTPAGGTELVGYGESRLYQSFFDLGGELVLHPTRYADSDRSRDITFFKSAPKPSSINFSGEDPQVMECTFTALADRTVNSAISLMAFGDSEQDVRA